jgi:hypothetical protein
MSSSETILTQQTHTGDSTVETVTGDAYKGDGYYGRSDGFHTVQYTLNNVRGTVSIQATLAVEPTSDDWFTVYTQEYTEETTASKVTNFTGNYVWIRAVVEYTQGTIENIKLNH